MADGKRRAKYDIYTDVIEVIVKKGVSSLTLISYGANLPVDRAKKILQLLSSHGFIREVADEKGRKYRATKRGLVFLETYRKLEKFFAGLEQPVSVGPSGSALPERVSTGYEEIDRLLLGGIPQNYSVILTSPSCNERQKLIDSFLKEGLENGNIVLDITTEARRSTIQLANDHRNNFHLFLCNPQAEKIVGGLANVSKLKGVGNLNEISIAIESAFHRMDQAIDKPRRICVEIVSDILLQHHALDTRRWLVGLTTEMKSKGFTVLAVMNPYMHSQEEVQAILDLFEGEIDIYEKESPDGLARYVKVRKMYDQEYMGQAVPMGRNFAGRSPAEHTT
jgi:predicted transcriptional regulator/KaiC/GvpD/RAD55 family RecA-like ATPase